MTDEDLFYDPESIYNVSRVASGEKIHDLVVRDGYALFWGEWPSNWTWAPFTLDGVRYNCTEQHMMAEKARLFKDEQALNRIMKATDPADQKAYGRKVRGFDERKWSSVCYNIVLAGNLEKYRQNPELCEKLLATGNLKFVEASPKDKIWGIGMDKNHPDATKPGKWLGKNLLGKVLDETRRIIRQERGL
jgi:ribA/ribD-fused uncharacterized protein